MLGLETVGVNTDFYEMGGDSIRSIMLVSELSWSDFTVAFVYRGRTSRGMAKLYEKIKGAQKEDYDLLEEEAEKQLFPMINEQQYFFDYQLYTPMSTMYNIANHNGGRRYLGVYCDCRDDSSCYLYDFII